MVFGADLSTTPLSEHHALTPPCGSKTVLGRGFESACLEGFNSVPWKLNTKSLQVGGLPDPEGTMSEIRWYCRSTEASSECKVRGVGGIFRSGVISTAGEGIPQGGAAGGCGGARRRLRGVLPNPGVGCCMSGMAMQVIPVEAIFHHN